MLTDVGAIGTIRGAIATDGIPNVLYIFLFKPK